MKIPNQVDELLETQKIFLKTTTKSPPKDNDVNVRSFKQVVMMTDDTLLK